MNEPIAVGDLVLLTGTDGFMPPIGSIGEVQSGPDEVGDYEVLFPGCPCPVPPGILWYVPRSMLTLLRPAADLEIVDEAREVPA